MSESMKEMASREKYWSEIDAEEKCARLRHRVKDLERDLGEMREQIRKLLKHQHIQDRLTIPLDSYGGQPERAYSRGKTNDDVYF